MIKNENPFLDFTNQENKKKFFETLSKTTEFEDILNEYAYSTPLGKDSPFYRAKKGSYRNLLETKGIYNSLKNNIPNLDFEKISYEEYSGDINIKYQ